MGKSLLQPRVTIREFGLCDGLRNIDKVLPTGHKLEWIRRAYHAGLRQMVVGAFIPGRRTPQLSDTAELIAITKQLPGMIVSVRATGTHGALQAIGQGADQLVITCSASDTLNLNLLQKPTRDVVTEFARIRAARDAGGWTTRLEANISEAFGCALQGAVTDSEVIRLVQSLLEVGADRVSLVDSVGGAQPDQVSRLFEKVMRAAGESNCSGHFHDNRRMALTNIHAAMSAGLYQFDASLASLGGSSDDPTVSGFVATEDVVYLLQTMGVAKDIDHAGLLKLRIDLASWLPGVPMFGMFGRADTSPGQRRTSVGLNHNP